MNKIVPLLIFLSLTTSAGGTPVKFDEINKKIYAVIDGNKIMLPFQSDGQGNPSSALGMFNSTPSLEISARSLHDYTVYATVFYSAGLFKIGCMFYDLKSKVNGLEIKYGECGLNAPISEGVIGYVESKVEGRFSKLDSIDTSSLLTGRIDYLPTILDRKKDVYIYKIYKNKEDLINGKYFLVTFRSYGMCTLHNNNTWIVLNKGSTTLFKEINKGGNLLLEGEGEFNGDSNTKLCDEYLPFRVASDKSYFYDEKLSQKNLYIVKGDYINLQRVDELGKWCKVSYFNEKGKLIVGNLLCSTLALK
ncbi:hypothetical protein ABEI05_24895 [Erwinia billingiae]|uniref:hypothetical protein n=1 Tax=Erwinia billingiae TaxID=182337 RepID=UPI00320B3FC4